MKLPAREVPEEGGGAWPLRAGWGWRLVAGWDFPGVSLVLATKHRKQYANQIVEGQVFK